MRFLPTPVLQLPPRHLLASPITNPAIRPLIARRHPIIFPPPTSMFLNHSSSSSSSSPPPSPFVPYDSPFNDARSLASQLLLQRQYASLTAWVLAVYRTDYASELRWRGLLDALRQSAACGLRQYDAPADELLASLDWARARGRREQGGRAQALRALGRARNRRHDSHG